MKVSPLTYFKGAHGISNVTTVAVARLNSNQIEIRSVWLIFINTVWVLARENKSVQWVYLTFIGYSQRIFENNNICPDCCLCVAKLLTCLGILLLFQTGGDGCICYFEYDRDGQTLEFIGMKQVKELSLIQSVYADNNSVHESSIAHYAAGFASVDFMMWNLKTETKVCFFFVIFY